MNQPGGVIYQDGDKLTALIEAQRQEADLQRCKQIVGDIQRLVSDTMIYVPTAV